MPNPKFGGGQLKVGSFTRSERMAKWNECLRIQDVLGSSAFVGGAPLPKPGGARKLMERHCEIIKTWR
ncbi:MAG: hypothetical protein MJK06_05785 [Hyphomicrobiales bacterium]|nr:hypothetical protein [Hyphomicrobiales bacterium]